MLIDKVKEAYKCLEEQGFPAKMSVIYFGGIALASGAYVSKGISDGLNQVYYPWPKNLMTDCLDEGPSRRARYIGNPGDMHQQCPVVSGTTGSFAADGGRCL